MGGGTNEGADYSRGQRSPHRPSSGRKVPWQRKVRRFFRRLKRRIRRIPRKTRALICLIVLVVLILIVVIGIVSFVRGRIRNKNESEEQEEEVAEEEVEEEEEEEEEESVLSRLQGLDEYTLVTQEEEVDAIHETYSEIEPDTKAASSVLTGATGTVFDAENMFDGDLSTSWQEGEEDDGVGVTLTFTFDEGTELIGIAFWIGNEAAEENYEANNRPEEITVSVSSNSQVYSRSYTLEDWMGEQVVLWDKAIPVESLIIRIDSVYEGTYYDDTVISELSFLSE